MKVRERARAMGFDFQFKSGTGNFALGSRVGTVMGHYDMMTDAVSDGQILKALGNTILINVAGAVLTKLWRYIDAVEMDSGATMASSPLKRARINLTPERRRRGHQGEDERQDDAVISPEGIADVKKLLED